MKKIKINRKIWAFSLVELMISLITISCIAAAFTPVITKKLKKQDVALSIAQTSEIKSPCPEFGDDCKLCTKAYCVTCEKNCPEGQYMESKTCTCKNCSEHDKIKSDALTKQKCVACDNNGCTKCKNEGSDEGKYYVVEVNGNSKNDTHKCNTCLNDTMTDDGGLTTTKYICDGTTMTDKSKCEAATNSGYVCINGIKKTCSAVFDWKCYTCNTKGCLSCPEGYYPDSTMRCNGTCSIEGCTNCTGACKGGNGACNKCNGCGGKRYPIYKSGTTTIQSCGRCWIDSSGNSTNCERCTSATSCTKCNAGYFVNSRGGCSECSLANCLTCKKGMPSAQCEECQPGYYLSGTVCSSCSSKVANCAACDSTGKCIACNVDYLLQSDGTCKLSNDNWNCNDADFMRVGNLCVTRKNIGDSVYYPIPKNADIIAVSYGAKCFASSQNCCWQGAATSNCRDDYAPAYSACGRTTCNFGAAQELCSKLTYGGLKWRLPTFEEAESLFLQHNINLGNNGLMLCDGYNDTKTRMNWCYVYSCPGSLANYCQAKCWWNTQNGTPRSLAFDNGAYYTGCGTAPNYAQSVRCVTELSNIK